MRSNLDQIWIKNWIENQIEIGSKLGSNLNQIWIETFAKLELKLALNLKGMRFERLLANDFQLDNVKPL